MQLIKNYMTDDKLRHKLNALTQKVFYFDFEDWVTNGYFRGEYIPYSFVENEKIISNASANIMKFNQSGEQKTYIQIGTVMTDENYRNQGLAGKIINTIINEYKNSCDGFYLFGDLGAVDFYKKLGFKTINQYTYKIKDEIIANMRFTDIFKKLNPADKDMSNKYLSYVKSSAVSSEFEQTNKFGLQMFYTAELENVYYSEKSDCFIVADIENNKVFLHSVLYKNYIPLEKIITELPCNIASIELGFTPLMNDKGLCECTVFDGGDDYRLFYLGNRLESIENDRLFFPSLSHA